MSSPQPKAITLIAGIVLLLAFPQLCGLLMHRFVPNGLSRLLWGRFVYCADVAVLICYARYVERQTLLLWAESKQQPSFYIKWTVLLYLLALAVSIISYIPIKLGVHDDMRQMLYWGNIVSSKWWLILLCSVTAGLTEELLIRGYIQTRLAQLLKNDDWPVVISALLFSALHYAYFSWREVIFTFLLGLVLAWHYRKFRNIKVLILVHFLIDFVSFSLFRFLHLYQAQGHKLH